MRRTLTIAAIAIVVLGLLVLGYFYFFTGTSGLVVDTGTNQNPFGTGAGDVTQQQGNAGGDTAGGADTSGSISGTQVAPHLIKITAAPVARGFLLLNPATTTSVVSLASTTSAQPTPGTQVRYIDRSSGNMYSYNVTQGTSIRLTNHTAPGVQEAAWVANGSLAFIRLLTNDSDKSEHIDTYALPADGSDGRFLAHDLSEVITQGISTVFTLMPSTSGSLGAVSKPDGTAATTIFSSPLSAITVLFAGPNLIAYTNPSAHMGGYAFVIDRKTGSFNKILGPTPGLSVLPSPSGKQALVTFMSNNSLSLSLFDVAAHTTTVLPVATLIEKCVWAPDNQSAYCAVPTSLGSGGLPDAWYQGSVSFSDRIWKIDLVARVATLVADLPQLSKDPIDAVSLTVDPNDSTLVFMNKRDGSLWAYSF